MSNNYNANQNAYPIFNSSGEVFQYKDGNELGLTKREIMAMHAMQNILSRYNPYEQGDFDSSHWEDVAKNSVSLADALLDELNK